MTGRCRCKHTTAIQWRARPDNNNAAPSMCQTKRVAWPVWLLLLRALCILQPHCVTESSVDLDSMTGRGTHKPDYAPPKGDKLNRAYDSKYEVIDSFCRCKQDNNSTAQSMRRLL
eukprot:NODE_2968_length_963_cov_7.604067_g2948_i0.p1 GENE.NODE_2968_length_963_cov_7.604067_g2948_i0~~NODE_2968_length_963_cov_7.604067_g2948_i0.p1  ORF type:complete len:115 (-),score=12.08 NODE_2968_length_963_cov_7.604067_g2948_i0:370-714(-)